MVMKKSKKGTKIDLRLFKTGEKMLIKYCSGSHLMLSLIKLSYD